ncbi:DUF4062 domain-containing protein [Endothiovibrio diazotrophicus]
MTTIYLSSTHEDLKTYRATVFDALRRSGYQVIAMEDYFARDDRPLRACLADVERADLYVGLFAFRYGHVPPAEHGNPEDRSLSSWSFATPTPRRIPAACSFSSTNRRPGRTGSTTVGDPGGSPSRRGGEGGGHPGRNESLDAPASRDRCR